jgi:ribose transport system permease protein
MSDASIKPKAARPFRIDLAAVAPFLALFVLLVLGTMVNDNFLTVGNLTNVLTRSAFIAIIAVGATFVISAGGLDLSVGAMAAFIASLMILFLNNPVVVDAVSAVMGLVGAGVTGSGYATIGVAMVVAIGIGAACGLGNGLISTLGRIEPFIVTLGTMGIFRGLTTWLAQGGSITMSSPDLRDMYRPVYFESVVHIGNFYLPVPIAIIFVVAAIGAFVFYRTPFGRHVIAVGSNEDVARYSGISVNRVRTLTYIIQGICVAVAVIVYVPRIGAATATTGLLWELQAITAVVVGGTALRGGVGRIWGTICGAFILEIVGNIMVLSDFISEYLIAAVQGAIIIIAMLVQRTLMRRS